MKPGSRKINIINILLLLALLALLITDILTYTQRQQSLVTNSWVSHTYKVLETANKAQLYITEIQAEMSDYLITNDPGMVTDIPRLEKVSIMYIDLLKYLTRDNPSQQTLCDKLQDLVKDKFYLISKILAVYNNGDRNGSAVALTNIRRSVMNNISEAFKQITQAEVDLLSQREANFNNQTTRSNDLFIYTALLSGGLLILCYVVLNYQSKRRETSEQLRKDSEIYKSAILESASDCIITIDETGMILSSNPQTGKIFQYRVADLLDKNVEIIMPDIGNALEKLSGSGIQEINGRRKSGAIFPTEITLSEMLINDKKIYVAIIRDITERKKIEILKNEFISVVSHELRTPLTSIRGSLGLLISGTMGEFPPKAKSMLDIANHNCDRLLRLINDILDIEKIEAGKMDLKCSVIDLNQIVEEAISMNKMYSDLYGVSLNLSATLPDIKVNVDPNRLMQVLANLISNAAKFSNKGGEIKITISRFKHIARVAVTDTGKGIPESFQTKIFQKFSQADSTDSRSKGGTGLGLSISRAIIEKLGGKMDFNSEENVGSTFYFDLPIENEKTGEHQTSAINADTSKEKLLICEDDEDQAVYLRVLLESANYATDIAGTVAEAKKFLQKNVYKALLLDLILPDQDGISFIRELRQNNSTRTLPIIVLSIIANTGQSILAGNAVSVLDWIEKPVDFNKLLNVINHIKTRINTLKPNILHVEDDHDIQTVIATIIDGTANITPVSTIQAAREKLKNEKFDIVILDLLLPDGNGAELISAIARQNIPIVVFSSEELKQEHSQSVQQAFVKSKTSNEELLATIKKLIQNSD